MNNKNRVQRAIQSNTDDHDMRKSNREREFLLFDKNCKIIIKSSFIDIDR